MAKTEGARLVRFGDDGTIGGPNGDPVSAAFVTSAPNTWTASQTFQPGAGGSNRFLSSTAITLLPYSTGTYTQPAGTVTRLEDEWGNVRIGPNPMQPAQLWPGNNNNFTANGFPLFDSAYLVSNQRWFMRHVPTATEFNNPANAQMGRANGAADAIGPYPTIPSATLTGVLNPAGGNINSLPANVTTAIPPNDKVELVSVVGGVKNVQTFTVTAAGAAAGANAIPVNPLTPTFAFPIGTNVYSPNGLIDQNGLYGVLSGQTLMKIAARGTTSPSTTYQPGVGGAGAAFQKDSCQIYAQAFEDNQQTAPGNNFQVGGGWFMSCCPTGLNQPQNDVFSWHANGFSATLNATLTRPGFIAQAWGAWGDFIIANNGYALGTITAGQKTDNSASNLLVKFGPGVGRNGTAGISFGSDGTYLLYRDDTGGGLTNTLRTNAALTVDGNVAVGNNLSMVDGGNMALGNGGAGVKIGTTTGQKLALWGATPVIQPIAAQGTNFTAGAGTAMNSASTSTGGLGASAYNFSDLVWALKKLGAIAL